MGEEFQQGDVGSPAEPSGRLSRRGLLQGALAVAATAPLAAACSSDGITVADPASVSDAASNGAQSSGGSGAGGGGGGGAGSATPRIAATAQSETWNEPWIWRPSTWPGESLSLDVIENQNPGAVIGFGNPNHILFSYGGSTPGPTIRMRGDEILFVKLRNHLGLDEGITYVGEYPDPGAITGYYFDEDSSTWVPLTKEIANKIAERRGNKRFDFCLGEHTNGIHTTHTTNLHTHGLHVRPGRNPDGTHSDNVILRLLPQQDLIRRESVPADDEMICRFLRDGEQINFLADDDQVGQADYEFRLGDVQGNPQQPHPPGTHWYHPHAHGATADQVTSGMAGFLIVEGDVDDAIKDELVGETIGPWDPTLKTGKCDYRERLMFIQRVLNVPTDPDSPRSSLQNNKRSASDAVNGSPDPSTVFMRPNAIERWRVLNGSVDGKGFRRLMVLRGRYGTNAAGRLIKVDTDGNPGDVVTRGEVEDAKMPLHQLAFDGVTLVSPDGEYRVKDLSGQGDPTADFPLSGFPTMPFPEMVEKYVACFENGDSLRNCYVRPNEVYLGPANRTDVLFKAPKLNADETLVDYSVIALGVILHADTPLIGMQQNVEAPYSRDLEGTASKKNVNPPDGPGDVIIASLRVTGDQLDEYDLNELNAILPPVPDYLLPINDDDPDLVAPEGGFRTRTVKYSGWGGSGMPLITAHMRIAGDGSILSGSSRNRGANKREFERFILANRDLEGLRFARRFAKPDESDEIEFVLMAPNTRTMAIDGQKFNPTNPGRPRMFLNSAEEWVVYNESDFLWGPTSEQSLPAAQYNGHYEGVPLTLGEGMDRFRDDPSFQVLTRAVDHPFHMHQNPFWVIRIDVPAADGELHNILEEPRWMDVVPLPRHRGRVVFRSRFADYVGTYVNHCHILQHEDNGMMMPVEVTPFDRNGADDADEDINIVRANYVVRDRLAEGGLSAGASRDVTNLYGRPSLDEGYVSNMTFVDANHTTGQTYPGFPITAP